LGLPPASLSLRAASDRQGRIAIANSDAAASAMFETAVEQGHRAVLDLNQF